MVMVETSKKGIAKMAVSDPSHKLKSLQLSLTTRFDGAGDNWQATWHAQYNISTVVVELPGEGLAGKSVVLEIKR